MYRLRVLKFESKRKWKYRYQANFVAAPLRKLNFFPRLKTLGLFLRESPMFKWIDRVCRFTEFWRNLAKMFVRYIYKAHQSVRDFSKIQIFFLWRPIEYQKPVRKFATVQLLKGFPKQPKVSHTLWAHHLQSDIVQSVWMSRFTQWLVILFRLAIMFSFALKSVRVPTKPKVAKYIVIFGFKSLLALQWYIVYRGFL